MWMLIGRRLKIDRPRKSKLVEFDLKLEIEQ